MAKILEKLVLGGVILGQFMFNLPFNHAVYSQVREPGQNDSSGEYVGDDSAEGSLPPEPPSRTRDDTLPPGLKDLNEEFKGTYPAPPRVFPSRPVRAILDLHPPFMTRNVPEEYKKEFRNPDEGQIFFYETDKEIDQFSKAFTFAQRVVIKGKRGRVDIGRFSNLDYSANRDIRPLLYLTELKDPGIGHPWVYFHETLSGDIFFTAQSKKSRDVPDITYYTLDGGKIIFMLFNGGSVSIFESPKRGFLEVKARSNYWLLDGVFYAEDEHFRILNENELDESPEGLDATFKELSEDGRIVPILVNRYQKNGVRDKYVIMSFGSDSNLPLIFKAEPVFYNGKETGIYKGTDGKSVTWNNPVLYEIWQGWSEEEKENFRHLEQDEKIERLLDAIRR